MMYKNFFFRLLTSLFFLSQALAAKDFSLGLLLGDPSGVTAKLKVSEKNAIAAGLSFLIRDSAFFEIYADYLWFYPHLIKNQNDDFFRNLSGYIGVGGVVIIFSGHHYNYYGKEYSHLNAGVRIPFGLEWEGPNFPLSIFLEVVPCLAIIPGMATFLQGGLGFRYKFD